MEGEQYTDSEVILRRFSWTIPQSCIAPMPICTRSPRSPKYGPVVLVQGCKSKFTEVKFLNNQQ